MIPTPALCRLCRRPIPQQASKCPYCGARRSLHVADAGIPRPRRAWPIWRLAVYATVLTLVVVLAAAWLWVVHDLKAPLSSAGDVATQGTRPSPAECAELIGELTRRSISETRVSGEIRARLRQCLDRR